MSYLFVVKFEFLVLSFIPEHFAFAQNWVNPRNAVIALKTAGSCSSLRSGRVGPPHRRAALRPKSFFLLSSKCASLAN